MSLYERAQKTSNPNLTKGQIASGNYEKNNKKTTNDLARLHKHVQKIISPDRLADYMTNNPERAKSEIRNAAERCFLSSE